MGTSLWPPGGISSTVATTCSRPCARRVWGRLVVTPSFSDVNSEHPDLTLEDRHGLREVVSRDPVLLHHRFPGGLGKVLDQPTWIVERPVRVVRGEQQDLVALHPFQGAGQLGLVFRVVQRLGGELDVLL